MASALEHSVEFDFYIENALSILNSYRNSSCKFVLKTEQETAVKEVFKRKLYFGCFADRNR
jgi:hypothetical protein